MTLASWQETLVEDFAVPATALETLTAAQVEIVRVALGKYVIYECDETRTLVLRALDAAKIPSSVLNMEQFRQAHQRFVADEESRRETAELTLALAALQRLGLPAVSRIDAGKREIFIGKSLCFRYAVKCDNVDLRLVDVRTGCSVDIFSGDPPERLGSAYHELAQKVMAWERAQVPDPKKVSEEPEHAVWQDADFQTPDGMPPDDGQGGGTA